MNLTMAGTIKRAFVVGATACALFAGASSAFAAPPNGGPGTIKTYGFESASDSFAETVATPNYLIYETPTTEFWGRTAQEGYSGTGAMWCAGSSPAAWPLYVPGTRGEARTRFNELADYYSSSVSFWYKTKYVDNKTQYMGTSDYFRFVVTEHVQNPERVGGRYEDIPATPDWAAYTRDLSAADVYPRLSRAPATLSMFFYDGTEDSFSGIDTTGTGPLVDDFKLVGYKYGPVTSVSATSPVPGQVDLTWAKPKRAINSSVDEERAITYRVYRALWNTDIWVELTTDGTRPTSGSFTDVTATPGTKYDYVVQAWDPASGDGRGQQSPPVTLALTLPTAVLSPPSRTSSATLYTWTGFSASGTIDVTHTTDVPVRIEYTQNKTGTKKTVTGTIHAGATSYTANIPALSPYGTWYMRAVHEDATHQRSESAWTSLSVSPMKLNAPAPRTTMYVNHSYTVSGSLQTAHTSGSAFRVNAYKWDSKKQDYIYQKYFPIKVTSYSTTTKMMKYTSSVKLPSKGSWRLRLKHMSHASEPMYVYSALSSKITVK